MKIMCKRIMLLIILQLFLILNISEAAFWSNLFIDGENFIDTGKGKVEIESPSGETIKVEGPGDQNVMDIMNDLYSILFPLGVVITVIVGGVLGIKFMIASAEDKAKIKESMIPYVVGSAVIYGAFGIWKICLEIFSNLS